MKPANDNNLARAYLDFEADKDLFHWAMIYAPELVISIKKLHGKDREREASNFVWFFKFERSFKERDAETKRSEIKVVK